MRVVVISGFFNPLHCGHVDYIKAATSHGDKLIVIVNSDEQVKLKGTIPFMNEEDRRKIVSNIKGVDSAVISIDKDGTVCESIRQQYYKHHNDYFFISMVFANGGDRKEDCVPEDLLEDELGIRMIYNVGGDKIQSSSDLIKKSGNFHKK
jgi:cytidyltransferase-like protein|tara:strand:- start:4134 stop:4583 length:450 start_codon:yes stop_codon:yes gene_type:complete